jgi:hypothetical protein
MITLLNGSTEVRVRSSEEVTVLPCGCAHTATRWLQACDSAACGWAEYFAQRAEAERLRRAEELVS